MSPFRGLALALFLSTAALAPATIVLAKPAAPAAATVPPIKFKDRVLPNGLHVYYSLDRTTPNVTVQVWYGVGSKDDPEGRSGFAHLFEHLMFKATKDLPAESFDRMTEDVGGFNNAFTADDTTAYYEVVPSNNLERLLWAESQRLGSLVVDEADFKSERAVVEEELRQRVLGDPYGRFFRLLIPSASFQVHPYRRSGIGSIDELEAATLDDVRAFHETYYRPSNAALIIVGNFDEAQLNAWVDKYFAPLKNPATPMPAVTVKEPPRTGGPRTVNGYAPNVPLPALAITWLGPAANDPDAPALTVLDSILSGGKSSRLYNSLVYDQQIAAEAFSSSDTRAQPGLFYVGAVMASGHTLDEGEKALRAEVAKLRAKPVDAAELAKAKTGLVADAVRQRETIDGRAFVLGDAIRTEGSADRANSDIAALQAVTAADVQRVAAKYLADDRLVVVRYQDESQRPAGDTSVLSPPPPKVESKPFTGQTFSLAPEGERQAPPALGKAVSPSLPTPSEKVLANGLRVIVARSSDLPLVTVDLTVKVGAASDAQGLAGTANVLADLLTEGTKTRSATQIALQTEALGANLGAGAGWESSSVTLNVMPDKLAPAMDIMADVVRNPVFDQEELDRVRDQDLDGLAVAYKRPGSIAGFVVAPVIYSGSPYGHPAGGTAASLKQIGRADLIAQHGLYWRPDNAILVITGDITPEQGFALAEKAFGNWKAPASPLPAAPKGGAVPAPRTVIVDMPNAGQASVVVAKRGILRSDPRYYEGIVANTVLGGGYSARLNLEIRVKRGLAYGANSSLSPRRGVGGFSASTSTKNPTAPEVVTLIKGEMTRLGGAPPTADELAARKSVLIGGYGRDLATTDGLANILGDLAIYGIDLKEIQVYTAKVDAVTPAQVQAFAADVFNPANASVIVVGDLKLFKDTMGPALDGADVIPLGELDLDSPTLRKPK
ncbi:zinc protease [Caulobacter ginsengisoli]|uniref:Zinc protease n=1 Tax=Caulobacter ginsengisoli TaxID=400775 RepID=A0ABU0ITZ4_9CAUL|nr:pitrilysin family protein [Caulobacter ginsengisoli]MDQ0465470.1 zinc protease [Caulobacter ginsengisoli]